MKAKFAGLPRTEEFARAAKQEIRFRDVESVRRAHHGVEPRARFVGHAKRRYQDAMRFLRATADAPAKLVQLCEPEALSMLNDHYRGVGHIHADFHYGCGHKDLRLVPVEALHDFVFFFAGEPSVQQSKL